MENVLNVNDHTLRLQWKVSPRHAEISTQWPLSLMTVHLGRVDQTLFKMLKDMRYTMLVICTTVCQGQMIKALAFENCASFSVQKLLCQL